MKELNKRNIVASLLLAVIFAVCTVFGREIMKNDRILYTEFIIYVDIIKATLFYFCILIVIDVIGNRWKFNVFTFIHESPTFLVMCEIMIIMSWGVIFLACFPGLAIYDGPCQLGEYYAREITSHHPYIHTLLLVCCEKIGGSYYTVFNFWIQAAVLSVSFIRSIAIIRKRKVSACVIIAIVVWMCIFPMHALMALATTKDTLFAALVLLYICELIDLLEYREVYWESKCRCIRFAVVSFLMAVFRNNGIYVLIGGSVVVFILSIKNCKRIIGILFIIFSFYCIYCGPIMGKLQIEKGNMREALSFVIQPLARVYHEENASLGVEDRERIEKIFGNPDMIWYESHKSDAAKSQFDTDFFVEELKDNVKLYFRLGLEYPHVYADAILANTYGNWYPFETLPDTTTYRMLFEMPEADQIESCFPWFYQKLYELGRESSYQNVPIIRLFFSTGIVLWVLLWGLACLLVSKRYTEALIYIPLVFLFATILLGPVALFRYTYPLLICLPVVLSLQGRKDICVKDI